MAEERKQKTSHAIRNTMMALMAGGGLAYSGYKINRALPQGFASALRGYVSDADVTADKIKDIVHDKYVKTPRNFDTTQVEKSMNRMLKALETPLGHQFRGETFTEYPLNMSTFRGESYAKQRELARELKKHVYKLDEAKLKELFGDSPISTMDPKDVAKRIKRKRVDAVIREMWQMDLEGVQNVLYNERRQKVLKERDFRKNLRAYKQSIEELQGKYRQRLERVEKKFGKEVRTKAERKRRAKALRQAGLDDVADYPADKAFYEGVQQELGTVRRSDAKLKMLRKRLTELYAEENFFEGLQREGTLNARGETKLKNVYRDIAYVESEISRRSVLVDHAMIYGAGQAVPQPFDRPGVRTKVADVYEDLYGVRAYDEKSLAAALAQKARGEDKRLLKLSAEIDENISAISEGYANRKGISPKALRTLHRVWKEPGKVEADYLKNLDNVKDIMSQDQRRLHYAAMQAQIDFAQELYGGESLKYKIDPNKLKKLDDWVQADLRAIDTKDLDMIFESTKLEKGQILKIRRGESLEVSVRRINAWMARLQEAQNLTTEEKQFVVNAFQRRFNQTIGVVMPRIQKGTNVHFKGTTEAGGVAWIDRLFEKGERSVVETELMRKQLAETSENLKRVLHNADDEAVKELPPNFLIHQTKTGDVAALSFEDGKFVIPMSRSVRGHTVLQGFSPSLGSPDTLEISLRGLRSSEDVLAMLGEKTPAAVKAAVAGREFVEITPELEAMRLMNEYMLRVINARKDARKIDNRGIQENLQKIIRDVMGKHSVWQMSQGELAAEGKAYRASGDIAEIDNLFNPFRAYVYGGYSRVPLELDPKSDIADIRIREHTSSQTQRDIAGLFDSRGILTREAQLIEGLRDDEAAELARVRMVISDKKFGELIGGRHVEKMYPGGQLRTSEERSALSPQTNRQMFSESSEETAREIEASGKRFWAKRTYSTRYAEDFITHKVGKSGWSRSRTADILFLRDDTLEELMGITRLRWSDEFKDMPIMNVIGKDDTVVKEGVLQNKNFIRQAQEYLKGTKEFEETLAAFKAGKMTKDEWGAARRQMIRKQILDEEVIAAVETAAKGHIVTSKKTLKAFQHVRTELFDEASAVDVEDALARLSDARPGTGVQIGTQIVPGVEGTRITNLILGKFNPATQKHKVFIEREIYDTESLKVFGAQRIRSTLRGVDAFERAIEAIEQAELHRQQKLGRDIVKLDVDIKNFTMFAGGKELGEGAGTSNAFRVYESKYLGMMHNLMSGRSAEPLLAGVDLAEFNQLKTPAERMRYLIEAKGGKVNTTMIKRLSAMFSEDVGAGADKWTILPESEGTPYQKQMRDIRSFLKRAGADLSSEEGLNTRIAEWKKAGLDPEEIDSRAAAYVSRFEIPYMTEQLVAADIPEQFNAPRLDLVSMMRMYRRDPYVFADFLKNSEHIEELQATLKAFSGDVEGTQKYIEKMGDAVNVKSLNDFADLVALSPNQLSEVMRSDPSAIQQYFNSAELSGKITMIDLGEEMDFGGAKMRYVPIMPRKAIANTVAVFDTAGGPVMGDYDKLIAAFAKAGKADTPEETTKLLQVAMNKYAGLMLSKKGVLVGLLTPRQSSAVTAQVAYNYMLDDMDRELRTIQNVEGQSLRDFTESYFAKKKIKTEHISNADVERMMKQLVDENFRGKGKFALEAADEIPLEDFEKEFGTAGTALSPRKVGSQGGLGRNLYEDIMSGKIQLVSGKVRDQRLTAFRYDPREAVGAGARFPIMEESLFREGLFLNFGINEHVMEVGKRHLELKNMDLDRDLGVFKLIANKKAREELTERFRNTEAAMVTEVQETLRKEAGLAKGETTFSIYGQGARAREAIEKYHKYLRQMTGQEELVGPRIEDRAADWAAIQRGMAEQAGRVSATGQATRLSDRVYLGMRAMTPGELMDAGALSWMRSGMTDLSSDALELERMQMSATKLLEALNQGFITARKEGTDINATRKLADVELSDLRKSLRQSGENYQTLWNQIRRHMASKWGGGARRIEDEAGQITDYGRSMMRILKVGFQNFEKNLSFFNSLLTGELQESSADLINVAKNLMDAKGAFSLAGIESVVTDTMARGGKTSAFKGVAKIAGRHAGPAIIGVALAAGIYGMSELGSSIDRRLDNRPEANLMRTDVPRVAGDNMLPSPSSLQAPVQFTAPEEPIPPATARLNQPPQARVVNVAYQDPNTTDGNYLEKKMAATTGSRPIVNVVHAPANSSRAYQEYRARREL